jgi:predicted GNAT family N-acyltransferase
MNKNNNEINLINQIYIRGTMNIECKLVETEEELKQAFKIRTRVFIKEQEVPLSIEWDEYDKTGVHMICNVDGKVVGTGRIVFFGKTAKISRVAVLKPYRKKNIGTAIMEFLIDEVKKRQGELIYAHVQLYAHGFYEKIGFKDVGESFLEANIEHIRMVYNENL